MAFRTPLQPGGQALSDRHLTAQLPPRHHGCSGRGRRPFDESAVGANWPVALFVQMEASLLGLASSPGRRQPLRLIFE